MNRPGYKVEVDNVTEAQWSELLDRFEDANLYQTWSYGSVRWGAKSLSHLVLKRNGEVVSIAQVRIIRPKNLNIGIAYLRWGPLCHLRSQDLDLDVLQAMAEALREEYVEKRRLYMEILGNAFKDSPRAQMFHSAFSRFNAQSGISGEKYRTFVVDLAPPLDEIRKKLDRKWRNQLTTAEKGELRVSEVTTEEEYRALCKLYEQLLERKQFDTTVSAEEFGQMNATLPPHQRMRTLMCYHNDQPVAGLICSVMGDTGVFLLAATSDEGRKLKGAYPLQWQMVQLLKESGVRYYDLGGIDPEADPGVYGFKSGFKGVDLSHISPLIACDSSLSAAFVKAGQFLRGPVRRFQRRFAAA